MRTYLLEKSRVVFQVRMEVLNWGWRDGSAVRSTACISTGHEFNSQHLVVAHNYLW
jgi:hypothetical protein